MPGTPLNHPHLTGIQPKCHLSCHQQKDKPKDTTMCGKSTMGRTSQRNTLVAIISRESQLIQICKGSKEKYDSMIYWYINK